MSLMAQHGDDSPKKQTPRETRTNDERNPTIRTAEAEGAASTCMAATFRHVALPLPAATEGKKELNLIIRYLCFLRRNQLV
jgi:hypothetical protein